MLLRAREVPGGGRFRVEEWVRCRQPDYSVPACPLRDVVAAYEFTDRFDNRLLVNRGSHDEVGYLGEGEWLITGYRDAAVLTARSDAPKRLTVRSDIVVMPEPDMVHAPCPDSVWRTADGWTAEGRTEPAACLVDESTWQLIRIVAPQVDVWHESPSQPLWGTRRSTQTGAHEAVVMQDDGTWGVSRIAASDRLVWPIANLPFGVLAVYRTGPGGTDPRELVVSTDGGLSWRVRHVPVDRLALLGENTRAELVLPEEWTTWTVVAPCHAVAPSVMAVRCNQTVG